MSVIVVGAGLLGSSVAYHLAGPDVEVTVLDAGRPGGGTSGASFAWVNAQEKSPAGYFALNAAGVAAYPGLAASLGGDWYHPVGDITISLGPAMTKLQERVDRHADLGYPARTLDRAGLAALEPGLDLGPEELLAAHWEAEAWIDPPVLIGRLLAAARAAGARVLSRASVVELEVHGGHVRHVRLASGDRLSADIVLIAAGESSEGIARRAGVTLPMSPTPGLLAISEPLATGVTRIVHAADVALRPDGAGRLMISSREIDATLDPSVREMAPDADPCRELLARAARIVPDLRSARIEAARVGIRSVPADGMPAAGFAPVIENAYFLVAHSGVSLTPVLGRLVAAELLGDRQPELEPYRLSRFVAGASG
ncbi:MAG: FAD-binding oxidoreductase [Candidatus Limnocylindrales bacterium]|nr:FAD-binding oxidoreductase [Candidatus Limnocylindrales bacterium]